MANFTNRGLRGLRPKGVAYYEVFETGRKGFGIRVYPSGHKVFIHRYQFEGITRRLVLGAYPALSLADAHELHAKQRGLLSQKRDPWEVEEDTRAREEARKEVERLAKQAAEQEYTVTRLAEEYLERYAKATKRSWKEDHRMLLGSPGGRITKRGSNGRKPVPSVVKLWGERKAREIMRRDAIKLLDDIVDRGAPIQANRTLACVRRMFNFAVERGILENSPCAGVKAPSSENRRDRVLSEDEIRAFWGSLDQASMTDPVKLALRFQLVTAQRKGEVIAATWDQFDLAATIWTIPTEKAKNKMAHRVPLSPLALDLLKQIRACSGDSAYLFPSPTGNRHITPTAVDHAMRNHMNAIRASDRVKAVILGQFTPHDLRRTAASHMTSMGIPRLVVSKILNHAESGVTAVYDRHSYDHDKWEALGAWGHRLEEIASAPTDTQVTRSSRTFPVWSPRITGS